MEVTPPAETPPEGFSPKKRKASSEVPSRKESVLGTIEYDGKIRKLDSDLVEALGTWHMETENSVITPETDRERSVMSVGINHCIDLAGVKGPLSCLIHSEEDSCDLFDDLSTQLGQISKCDIADNLKHLNIGNRNIPNPIAQFNHIENSLPQPKLQIEPTRRPRMNFHWAQDSVPNSPFIKLVRLTCSYDDTPVGVLSGRQIERQHCKHNFMEILLIRGVQVSFESAWELFDRYGRLKPEFMTHEFRKGTGDFGQEFSLGGLFFLEDLCISPRYWHAGIASILVQYLSNYLSAMIDTEYIIARPSFASTYTESAFRDKTPKQRQNARTRARVNMTKFLRSEGYRRVGMSHCLAFALDSQHPSHKLTIENDPDPEFSEDVEIYAEDGMDLGGTSSYRNNYRLDSGNLVGGLWKKYPLHEAVAYFPYAKFVALFEDLRLVKGQEEKYVLQLDPLKQNILHVAACAQSPDKVAWIIDNLDYRYQLSHQRDINGYTPFEALSRFLEHKRTLMIINPQIEMKYRASVVKIQGKAPKNSCSTFIPENILVEPEALRESWTQRATRLAAENAESWPKYISTDFFPVIVSDYFRGHPSGTIDTLIWLQNRSHEPSLIDKLIAKYGCTCKLCIEGIMSPRMKKSLLDTTNHVLERLSNVKKHILEIVFIIKRFNKHWPSGLRYRVCKEPDLRAGFLEILSLISYRLENDIIPRVERISGSPPLRIDGERRGYEMGMSGNMWMFYREAGGVESTLRTVFELAMDRDEVIGSGEIEMSMDWEWERQGEAVACRNDLEYGFVANMCGVFGLKKMDDEGKMKGPRKDNEVDGYFDLSEDERGLF